MTTPIKQAIFEAPDVFAEWLRGEGEPPYRGRQIGHWIVAKRADAFAEMTDLPGRLRLALDRDWEIFGSRIDRVSDADDGTEKLLLRLADGETIECVLLREKERRTICMSTQVGCAMGCVFCASGLGGLVRNLSAGEMIEELLHVWHRLPCSDRLSHVVVMGMGEPLANLSALIETLAFATGADGLGISARHVTISTVGLPAKIRRLAAIGKPYQLAVSLHAPNDALRRRIVPAARRVRLADLVAAADCYRAQTGRQVTFEYVLLAGVNDASEHADQLARLLEDRDAFVNLIPYNPVAGLEYRTPAGESSSRFADRLRRAGLTVKIRKRKGNKIDAACGQLRRSSRQQAVGSRE